MRPNAMDDAIDMFAMVFSVMVCLTVAPVVPLIIFAVSSDSGYIMLALAVFAYLGLPLITGMIAYVMHERNEKS